MPAPSPVFPGDQVVYGSFPGLVGIESITYTASQGITPSIAVVVCNQEPLPGTNRGDLVITDGHDEVVVRDCALVNVEKSQGSSGQTWTVQLQDRRWRWAFSCADADVNELDDRGKLVPWSIRSPKELAVYLLGRMKEANYVIDLPDGLESTAFTGQTDWFEVGDNAPPTGTNPRVEWVSENPAQALARLCDEFNRLVTLDPVSDRVVISRVGVGQPLPPGHAEVRAANIGVPAAPKGVGVKGAPVRVQTMLRVVAVGREWNNRFYPIEGLSYAPDAASEINKRWDFCGLGELSAVKGTDRLAYDIAKEYAASSVYRVYRLANVGVDTVDPARPTPIVVPGYGPVKDRHQLVVLGEQVEQVGPARRNEDQIGGGLPLPLLDHYDGYSRNLPAKLYGPLLEYYARNPWSSRRGQNTPDGERLDVIVQVDTATQLVQSNDPLVFNRLIRYAGPGATNPVYAHRPAPVVLRAAVMVRDEGMRDLVRFKRWRYFGQEADDNALDLKKGPTLADGTEDTDIEWHTHDDVDHALIAEYEFRPAAEPTLNGFLEVVEPADGWYGGSWHLKPELKPLYLDDTRKRADNWLDQHTLPWLPKSGETATYIGIVPVELDGSRRQVTYTVGPDGATTVASRDCEHGVFIPNYPARRRQENLAPDPIGGIQNRVRSPGGGRATDVIAEAARAAARAAIGAFGCLLGSLFLWSEALS